MLDDVHLGHQIGVFHQRLRSVASGDDDVLHIRSRFQGVNDILHRQPSVVHGVGELVEDNQIVLAARDDLFGVFPQGAGQVGAGIQILRTPGETVSHSADGYTHLLGRPLLPKVGGGVLDELEHHDFHVAAPGPHQHTHGSSGLALPVAGVYDHQPLVDAWPPHGLGSVACFLSSHISHSPCRVIPPTPLSDFMERCQKCAPAHRTRNRAARRRRPKSPGLAAFRAPRRGGKWSRYDWSDV